MTQRAIPNFLLIILCLSAAACGEEAPAAAPAPVAIAPGAVAPAVVGAAPVAVAAAAVGAAVAPTQQVATIGGPAVSVVVPMPPLVRFDVATFAEYQIDVEGQRDAHAYLYRAQQLVEQDDDGGDGRNSRIIVALTPGAYEIRLHEHTATSDTMQARVTQLAPLVPVAALTVGTSFEVATAHGDHERLSMSEVTLTIATAGEYRIEAMTPATSYDPKIRLMQQLEEIETDDDGGDGHNARIDRHLEPGTYQLRVWDFSRRAGSSTVSLIVQP